jgi:hypothetical protein
MRKELRRNKKVTANKVSFFFSCGNINWARRDKCNVCNAIKPSYTQSPRTGRAGGHYDLQDP